MEQLLLAWFHEHGRDLPWRRTRDPYAILVSEVMLQQTQVERVVPRYLGWLERWPTVPALARLMDPHGLSGETLKVSSTLRARIIDLAKRVRRATGLVERFIRALLELWASRLPCQHERKRQAAYSARARVLQSLPPTPRARSRSAGR